MKETNFGLRPSILGPGHTKWCWARTVFEKAYLEAHNRVGSLPSP